MRIAMKKQVCIRRPQRGFLLIEALIAVLIFSLGVLGMVAMSGTAIGAQSDARYRTDAARLADDMASNIALGVDRTTEDTLRASLAAFQHLPGGAACAFSGDASVSPAVTTWLSQVTATASPGLPGSTSSSQQISISNTVAGFNRVEITLCWKAPGTPDTTAMRRHTLVTYVN